MNGPSSIVPDGRALAAISAAQERVDQPGQLHHQAIMALDELGNLYETLYVQTKGVLHLHEAMRYRVSAIHQHTLEGYYQVVLLNSASRVAMRFFDHSKDPSALGNAEMYARDALTMYPYGHPNRFMSLHNLAIIFLARFEEHELFDDLEKAIAFTCEALAASPKDGHELLSLTCNLASARKYYLERMQQMHDEDPAIAFHLRGGWQYSSMMARLEVSTWLQTNWRRLTGKGQALVDSTFSLLPTMEDREHVIAILRAILTFIPKEHAIKPRLLYNLANYIANRFMEFEQAEDLEEVIVILRDVHHHHPQDVKQVVFLRNLALLLSMKYAQKGEIRYLKESITCDSEALEMSIDQDDSQVVHNLLEGLARLTNAVYERTRETEHLEKSVMYQRKLLELHGISGPIEYLKRLAASALALFFQTERIEHPEESVSLQRRIAVGLLGDESNPVKFRVLDSLAGCTLEMFERTGNLEYLKESIKCRQALLDVPLNGHHERFTLLEGLAGALFRLFEATGRMQYADDAILWFYSACSLCPEDHARHCGLLNEISACFIRIYEKTGKEQDFQEAIRLGKESCNLALQSGNFVQGGTALTNVASAQLAHFRRTSRMQDLQDAIQNNHSALNLLYKDHPNHWEPLLDLDPEHWEPLLNLAACLEHRYEQTGEGGDLEKSITIYQKTMELIHPTHPQRLTVLHGLAGAITSRIHLNEEMDDIRTSIQLGHDMLELCPQGHAARSYALGTLASGLYRRFAKLGHPDDLRRSIALDQEALDLGDKRTAILCNLALSLYHRFTLLHRIEDLDEAIKKQKDALSRMNIDGYGRSLVLGYLGSYLSERFNIRGQAEDIEEAIFCQRSALEQCPEGCHYRGDLQYRYALSLARQSRRSDRIRDIEEAIDVSRKSLEKCPENHGEKSRALRALADLLFQRFEQRGTIQDLEDAMKLYEGAIAHPLSSLLTRLEDACRWARAARKYKHKSSGLAYTAALSALERIATTAPTLDMQHRFLISAREAHDLTRSAASYAIEIGNVEHAVVILEQGRALLWSNMHALRNPVEQLKEENKALATQFEDVSRQLETLTTSGSLELHDAPSSGRHKWLDDIVAKVLHLRQEQESLIAQIRRLPGFDDFLAATPFEKLREAAKDGPVVIVNVCDSRCDAIIVFLDDPPALIPLYNKFYDDSVEVWQKLTSSPEYNRILPQALQWLRNKVVSPAVAKIKEYGVPVGSWEKLENKRRGHKAGSPEYNRILAQVLQMLWDRVVSLVVVKLKEFGVPDGHRIWWCPTAFLSSLPFHAAGPFLSSGGKKCFLDDYVPSYTPTLKALIRARDGIRKRTTKILFVGDTSLRSVKEEEEKIERCFEDSGQKVRCLMDNQASHKTVLDSLPECRWIHMSCHGKLDPSDSSRTPFDASFKLFDKKLTLLDITRANIRDAEFAFLSACHSAALHSNSLHDEVLHLAAGMQFCGFRSVIGTMWELLDKDGPTVARLVYGELSPKTQKGEIRFKRSAAALNKAVLDLREKLERGGAGDTSLERWVNFIHIGA